MREATVCNSTFDPARRCVVPTGGNRAQVSVYPYALVYIDDESEGSPNCGRRDPFCYLDQAVTLNRSLLALGLPKLTVATNVPEAVEARLQHIDHAARPGLEPIKTSLALPRSTRFYSAHFKLDLLFQVGQHLPEGSLVMLLDTDMVAMQPLNADLLSRCQVSGIGAYDVSDQEFSAYGNARVIRDLETVAGKRLLNPRWFGGELLLADAAFIRELVPCARECFHRYIWSLPELNHQGDEMFMSAALNLLAERGHQIIDIGAHRLVGRHWSGNTHRDLRWFKGCSLLHLPGCKRLLERQAHRRVFTAARIWRSLILLHQCKRVVWPLRRWIRARRGPHGDQRNQFPEGIDVLVLDPDVRRLSMLASRLTSVGMQVMLTVDADEASREVKRLAPRVIVASSPLGVQDASDLLDDLIPVKRYTYRPVTIAFSSDDTQPEWVEWDWWFPRSSDPADVVQAVADALARPRADARSSPAVARPSKWTHRRPIP